METTNKWMPTNFRSYLSLNKTRQLVEEQPIYIEGLGVDKYAVKNNLEVAKWATGYIPEVHQSFLSYQKAKRLKDVIRDKVLGGGIFLENNDGIIDESLFYKFLAQVLDNTLVKGSCIAKVNLNDGICELDVIPLGYYKVAYGLKKKIIKAKVYLNKLDSKEGESYVLVEKRYFKNNDSYGYGRYKIERWTFDDYSGQISDDEIDYDMLPDKIKQWIDSQEIDFTEHKLFKNSIGIYQFDNTWTNTRYPSSNVGESLYLDLNDLFYALDHAFTAKENDKYIGRGRVIVPKPMQSGVGNIQSVNNVVNGIGQSMVTYGASRGVLDNTFYNEIPSNFDNSKAKPEPIQFALRTQEWRMEIEGLLGDIAAQAGVTASMLDSRIVGSGQKTAYQVCAEEDLTRATIEDKRALLNCGLKPLFEDLKEFYQLANKLSVRWPQSGLSNYSLLSQTTISEYNAGLISLEVAIKRLHPDWNQEEIEKEIASLEGNAENIINQFNNVDNEENDNNDEMVNNEEE